MMKSNIDSAKMTTQLPQLPTSREDLLQLLRELYAAHGYEALSTDFLANKCLYRRLLDVGLKQPDYLAALGLAEEFAGWKFSNRTYAGKPQARWSWDRVLETARQAVEEHGELPAMDWFRKNGQTGLVNAVFRSGHSWEGLRESLGQFSKSTFRQSRNGMRWLSQPETSMSDFLYARGIKHERGQRYDEGYALASGRRHGTYDMHFLARDGRRIDVEIWGDLPDSLSGGKYAATRALKESWHAGRPDFLGIQFQDCYSDAVLEKKLEPYIGMITPFVFDKPTDHFIETSHWTDGDELLETCRQIAAQMPDGIFPNEQWLRKRGKYANRPGDVYNSVALRVNQWLGGTRNVRMMLGQASANTHSWTPESAIKAWRDFHTTHGVAPTALSNGSVDGKHSADAVKLANAIRAAVTRLGVLEEARAGKKGRDLMWTEEMLRAAWRAFEMAHGFPPSKAVGTKRRSQYSKEVGNEAARIYNAARKYGVLAQLRVGTLTHPSEVPAPLAQVTVDLSPLVIATPADEPAWPV
jgi:hypothetical protein